MQELVLKTKGLYSFPNPLGSVPEGALSLALNVIIDRDDTIETRRGQKQYNNLLAHPFQAMYNFNTTLMGWDTNNQFWYDTTPTWTSLSGSYSAPSSTYRIKGAEASNNMYFATSTGVIGLTAPNSTFYPAGVQFPLDSSATLNPVVGAWFAPGNTVGYRLVLGYTDTNNNLHLSPPAQRLVFSNPGAGAASTVTITWYIPPSLPLGYFYQLYRTKQTADIGGIAQDPGDEEYLVVQKTLTSTDISNKFITYTDSTPDVLLGTVLYTNPSQQTIAGANFQPPLAKDIAFYKGNMLYANTATKQTAVFNMITTQTIGDTLTIGGVIYTAAAAENAAIGQFKVFTTGTTGQNIDNTARSLVHVINTYGSNTVYWAVYTSNYTSLPGQITLWERAIGGSSFALTSSNGTVYSPQIPLSGTSYSSSNQVNKHYVYVSKNQIPEAVPLGNFIPIGTADKAILRILALRDSVFVFKEDGIWRILGTDITNFTVSLFDSTIILTSLDSAVPLNNQIWCLTNQGVVAVSDSGSVIMSRPIERDLLTLSSALFANFAANSFGIRYESDRHYMLALPTFTTDTTTTQIFINNFITTAWVNWPLAITAGIVSLTPDDHLYLCYSTGQVTRERKNWNSFDYTDFEYPITLISSTGKQVTVSSTTNIVVGDTLFQVDGLGIEVGQSIITSVDSPTQIHVQDIFPWLPATAATIYTPIPVDFMYTPVGGNKAWVKRFGDFQAFFRDVNFTNLTFGFSSDFFPTAVTVSIPPTTSTGFGEIGFGIGGFGGDTAVDQVVRTKVPRDIVRCHWLTPEITHSEALSNFSLTGINMYFDYVSSRQH